MEGVGGAGRIAGSGSKLIFDIFISDEDDEIMPPGCTSVYLKALRQGYVIVTARYKYKDINIKATVTVAAYIPLKVGIYKLILTSPSR